MKLAALLLLSLCSCRHAPPQGIYVVCFVREGQWKCLQPERYEVAEKLFYGVPEQFMPTVRRIDK